VAYPFTVYLCFIHSKDTISFIANLREIGWGKWVFEVKGYQLFINQSMIKQIIFIKMIWKWFMRKEIFFPS